MTVRIRLKKLQNDNYELIVVDSRKKRDTKDFLERVGYYNPRTKKSGLNKEAIQKWINKGAQPTQTCKNLIKKHLKNN